MPMPTAIAHVDADCFYVSAERVRDDSLIGKPVGVLGNQDACIIAKSYEMKAYGIKTGMPIWEARKKCPHGIYVRRDFRWYEVLSRRILETIQEFSPQIEYYSIDEFFFAAIPLRGKDLQETAEAIRNRVLERVRVPVTVGVAKSRTLAKLISDSAKPFGARAILDDEAVTALLASLPVTEIAGVAGRRARRLEPWGIRTCLDLAQADRRLVRDVLTASGEAIWWELRGEPVVPIDTERPLHKALSRGGSFGESTTDPAILWAWLVRHLERLIEELEYHDLCAGRVTVWVDYRDGRVGMGHSRIAAPTQRFDLLLDALRPCLRRAWIPKVLATRMHVTAEELVARRRAQLGLFDAPCDRAEAIARLKRAVNERLGRFVLRSAATLPLVNIYRDPSRSYDIGDIRGKKCF